MTDPAAAAPCLPCGTCGSPQPLGAAICSDCGMPPAWIVEPCPECHGSPTNFSAPAGQSDFSGGGCPKCEGGWVPSTCEAERSAAWLELVDCDADREKLYMTELLEAGDADLPDPADEYARREATLARSRGEKDLVFVSGPRFAEALAAIRTPRPLAGHRGEVAGREIERPILFEDDDEHPPGWLIAVGSPQRFVRELPGAAGLITLTEEAGRAKAYDSRNAAEERAAEFGKWPLCEGLAIEVVPGPFDTDSIRRLLGEAIEMIEERGPTPGEENWIESARPFARFASDASEASAPSAADMDAEQGRQRLAERCDLLARLKAETLAVEERSRARQIRVNADGEASK